MKPIEHRSFADTPDGIRRRPRIGAFALAASIALASQPGAQEEDDTVPHDHAVHHVAAHGITPAALAGDELPAGWVRLENPLELAELDAHGPVPCSVDDSALDGTLEVAPWPGGIVPYEFDANVSVNRRLIAVAAMLVLQEEANIAFVLRSGEADFLHIQDDTVNRSSSIGYQPGQTTIRIVSWGTQGVVIHEYLHALGFYHEQSRPDREPYIDIVDENIQAGSAGNFTPAPGSFTPGPYDFGSIMHYTGCAFSICCPAGTTCACGAGCETILAEPAYSAFQSTMGQRVALSPLDVHALRSLYPYSNWRFVDAAAPFGGNGTGTAPWSELTSALTFAPAGARVFVMPGTYDSVGLWPNSMSLEAPIGGVVAD